MLEIKVKPRGPWTHFYVCSCNDFTIQRIDKAVCAQTSLACLQRAEERMGQGECVQIINKSNVLNLVVSQHYSFLVTALQPSQNLGFWAWLC